MPAKQHRYRAEIKAAVLDLYRRSLEGGEPFSIIDLSLKLRCSASFLYTLHRELISEGLLPDPGSRQREDRVARDDDSDIEARIALVRAEKLAKLPHRMPKVDSKQLRKLLP